MSLQDFEQTLNLFNQARNKRDTERFIHLLGEVNIEALKEEEQSVLRCKPR